MKTIELTKHQRDLVVQATREVRNYYTGRGKHTSCGADHVGRTIEVFGKLGLVEGRHYVKGNDAPRGGWEGNYVKLTAAGKRLAVIRKIQGLVTVTEEKAKAAQIRRNGHVWRKKLAELCAERLTGDYGKAHRKGLNHQIRSYAESLGLEIGIDVEGFCRQFIA